MRKNLALLLITFMVLNVFQFNVFAAKKKPSDLLDEWNKEFEEEIQTVIELISEKSEDIDTENIEVLLSTSIDSLIELKQSFGLIDISKSVAHIVVPIKNSDTTYTYDKFDELFTSIYWENGIYSNILAVNNYDIDKLVADNNLPEIRDVACVMFNIYGGRLFGFYIDTYSLRDAYIIPVAIYERFENSYNYLENPEYEFEFGKAYSLQKVKEINNNVEKETTARYVILNDENGPHFVENDGSYYTRTEDGDVLYNDGTKTDNHVSGSQQETPVTEKEEEPEEPVTEEKEETPTEQLEETPVEEQPVQTEKEEKSNEEKINYIIKFNDIPETHWAYKEVGYFANKGVIQGYGNGYFGTDDSITYNHLGLLLNRLFSYNADNTSDSSAIREDIIAAVVKALEIDVKNTDESVIEKNFSDCENIKSENRRYIAAAIEKGLAIGSEGMLYPQDNLTRAETAVLLYRATKFKN